MKRDRRTLGAAAMLRLGGQILQQLGHKKSPASFLARATINKLSTTRIKFSEGLNYSVPEIAGGGIRIRTGE
jgi:hypothetical protein